VTGIGYEGPRPREGGFRVAWVPGSDRLHGICHCGADRVSEDPVELWTWLYDHPVGHRPEPEPRAGDAPPAQHPTPQPSTPQPSTARRSSALVPRPVGITP